MCVLAKIIKFLETPPVHVAVVPLTNSMPGKQRLCFLFVVLKYQPPPLLCYPSNSNGLMEKVCTFVHSRNSCCRVDASSSWRIVITTTHPTHKQQEQWAHKHRKSNIWLSSLGKNERTEQNIIFRGSLVLLSILIPRRINKLCLAHN